MTKIYLCTILVFSYLLVTGQTGLELMKKQDEIMKVNDQSVELEMELINSKGNSRERKLNWLIKSDESDNVLTFIRFLAPANIAGTGFLILKHQDTDDEQWLYLPALRKSRKISSNEQSNYFMGSDFTYEDIGDEDLDKFNYTLLKQEKIDEVKVYIIEAIPNNDKAIKESGYNKRIIYLRKDNYVIQKIEYFDKNNKLFKILTTSDIKKIGDSSKWRAHRFVMKKLDKNSVTILSFSNYILDKGIDINTFTKRNLENW